MGSVTVKTCQAVLALRCDCALAKRDNLSGDGQAQPVPTGTTPCVKPVKLFKNPLQFFFWNRFAAVEKPQRQAAFAALGFNGDFASFIAVNDGVSQKIVEHPLHFVGVAVQQDVAGHGKAAGQTLFIKNRLKFIDKLL